MRQPSVTLGILLSALLLPLAHAAEVASDTVQKTLPAKPGGRLIIETDRGSITVSGGSRNEVAVEVTRRVTRGSEKSALDLIKRHSVTITESEGTIRIDADLSGQDRWSFRGPQLEVSIRVEVPSDFHLQAQTAGGSIRATDLKGEVTTRTSGGSLQLEDLEGKVLGRTSGGSIRGGHLRGPIDLATAGGSIHLEGASGGPIKVGTSGGSLRLTGIEDALEAHTSGGSIHIESAATPLVASTSGGSVETILTHPPTGPVELRTSGGGVSLTLPEASAFTLDASTSAGSVRSDFPISVTESGKRSSLKGPVNGGGPLVKLRSSAGSIRVRTR